MQHVHTNAPMACVRPAERPPVQHGQAGGADVHVGGYRVSQVRWRQLLQRPALQGEAVIAAAGCRHARQLARQAMPMMVAVMVVCQQMTARGVSRHTARPEQTYTSFLLALSTPRSLSCSSRSRSLAKVKVVLPVRGEGGGCVECVGQGGAAAKLCRWQDSWSLQRAIQQAGMGSC